MAVVLDSLIKFLSIRNICMSCWLALVKYHEQPVKKTVQYLNRTAVAETVEGVPESIQHPCQNGIVAKGLRNCECLL